METKMRKFTFAALALLGLALGTASLVSPAHAYTSFAAANTNEGSNN